MSRNQSPLPRIFSAIQPTGSLHLGNYLGALKNWVSLQDSGSYECFFMIADYHALTGNQALEERRSQILRTTAEMLALGIDPERSTIFVQSHVPEHTELAWIFNCVTPISELERMTQYKDKSKRQVKNINTGLLTYPTLMASDILLYHSKYIPVGHDQIQHIELTNDVVKWYTKRFGKYFTPVKSLFTETPKVMSLLEPTKKMSKSLGGDHVIDLADEPEVIARKLKKAVTATQGGGDSPGVANLLHLYELFGESDTLAEFRRAERDGSIRYGELKQVLGNAIGAYFADFRVRRSELMNDHDEVGEVLSRGMERARDVSRVTMERVRSMIGVR